MNPSLAHKNWETENILSSGCPSCHLPFCLKETEALSMKTTSAVSQTLNEISTETESAYELT